MPPLHMKEFKRWRLGRVVVASLLLFPQLSQAAYDLDLGSRESIKDVARKMTEDMMSYYHGDKPGGTPGLLPEPYYWWEAGAMFGALIDYWFFTGDSEYNNVTTEALLFQAGPVKDYMPPNQTLTEGNDDQGFWGLAVMSAAEFNFPNPPNDQPQWLALAQAVFNTQVPRWDMQYCNGGLRWQIFDWNKGFNYKNSISMACFFALSARLALYTGNQSYADWADTTWDWMMDTGFMHPETYYIYDGAHIETNCTDIVPYQWSYNAGGFLHGAAAMYNFTENDIWKDRVDKLLGATAVFFRGPNKDIMTEVACESVNLCDTDQQSFKAYLSRWLAITTKWAPWTYDTIKPWLRASAEAATKKCISGANGRLCGLKWSSEVEGWDPADLTGVGQQMAAMETVIANLILEAKAPLSSDTGGTSKGDPAAGTDDLRQPDLSGFEWATLDTGDRVGAWIATAVLVISMLAAIAFMFVDDWDKEAWQKRKQVVMAIWRRAPQASLPSVENPHPPRPNVAVTPSASGSPGGSGSSRTMCANSSTETTGMAGTVGTAGVAASVILPRGVKAKSIISRPESYSFMAVGNEQAVLLKGMVVPPVPTTGATGRSSTDTSKRNSIVKSLSMQGANQIPMPSNETIGIATTTWELPPPNQISSPKSNSVYLNEPAQHLPPVLPELTHLATPQIHLSDCQVVQPLANHRDTLPHCPPSPISETLNTEASRTRVMPLPPGVAVRTSSLPTEPYSPPRRSPGGYIYNHASGSRTSQLPPEEIGVAVSFTPKNIPRHSSTM